MVLERYSPRLVPQLDYILSLAGEEEVKVRRVNQLLKPLGMELVRGSWRNKPFYRVRVPYEALRKRPPIPLARTWLGFSAATYNSYGQRGLKPVTTKEGETIEMPPACLAVQKACRGFQARPFNPDEVAEKLQKALLLIAQHVTRSRARVASGAFTAK